MTEYLFYDTSSLLLDKKLFSRGYKLVISSISLDELENIKNSNSKDEETKAAARSILNYMAKNPYDYIVHTFKPSMLEPIKQKDLEITPDMKILSCAIDYDNKIHPDEVVFITNDLGQYLIANLFFGRDSIRMIEEEKPDDYKGYIECKLNDRQMADFYQNQSYNLFDLKTNEYVIIKDWDGNVVDHLCWTGFGHRPISFGGFESEQFGMIKPMKGDIQQQFAFDSLIKNKITMLRGAAGTGKSLISLGFLFYCLEKGKIDKIIIFCNTVAARGAAKLGFYPGDRTSKLLDSQIGNMLSSKLGSQIAVEQLIEQEKLVLLPFSDIRGYDTSGMKAGVYITEAQNLDINLMKLALQRIGEDSICIIDGDDKTQLDLELYAGKNNGMCRVSQVFRGQDIYGEVELKTIHRSKIGQIAESM